MVLAVRPEYFFDQPQHELPQAPPPPNFVAEMLASSEGVALVKALQRLPDNTFAGAS